MPETMTVPVGFQHFHSVHDVRLFGAPATQHEWKNNDGNPIIFDGMDLSNSLLGKGPGKRDAMINFAGQSFGAVRVKNFKAVLTAKDTWLGPSKPLKGFAIYDLWWDPGEQYDIAFNVPRPQAETRFLRVDIAVQIIDGLVS